MKRIIFLAACIAALALCATSCYQPTVTELGDNLVSFTKKVDRNNELVGVKNTLSNVVIVEPKYEVVYYKLDYIVAANSNRFAIFDNTGQRVFEDLNIIEAGAGNGYFIFKTSVGKYFFLPHQELCGPAADFVYYPGFFLLFAKGADGKYGVYDPTTGETVLEQKYTSLVFACDERGNMAYYYPEGKLTKKITQDGKVVTVTTANLNLMKKEAEAKKTPWPKDGVGVVMVKTSR